MNLAGKFHVGQTIEGTRFEVDRAALTKHAIILGATGSGKTVLAKVLVEEAALQGIPTFAIDPKGDIGNLAFKSADFDFSDWSGREADALKIDRTKHAADLKNHYAGKASEFNVTPGSAESLEKVTVRIFTPKSSSGLAVGISPDLSAPENFGKLLSEDFASAADLLDLTSFNLLRLAGYGEGNRKEITFVSAILEDAWKAGQSLSVAELIRRIESPTFRTIGTLPYQKVVSDRERKDLATKINLLVSDPKLRSWSSAEAIDFSELFASPSINVLDLRNIQSEKEKHLFVELILQRLFQWLIKQGSAQTLRYLFYFDEIAGYCPPVREPPSKKLLLLLIKQARAFGLGMILASQNAVDLDYKVISNANVRFIGRLGAQRDIQRVSVGLELDSFAEQEIARLGPGEFYCNIFDPRFKSVIKSRWTLTYHRGPLDDSEISQLMDPFKKAAPQAAQPPEAAEMETVGVGQFNERFEAGEPQIPMAARRDETFLLLPKRFGPSALSDFIKLGSNLKSLKVLSTEQEERLYPVFELTATVSEQGYAKESLEKVVELAAFGGELIELPKEHSITPERNVHPASRADASRWKGELEKTVFEMEKDLARKFDIIIEEKRVGNVDSKSAKPRAKIASIDAAVAGLRKSMELDKEAIKKYEKLSKELKKESKKKRGLRARLISAENRIESKKLKLLSTQRKIGQMEANRREIEDSLLKIEEAEEEKFHEALGNVKSKAEYKISGWLVETVYRARILVNGSKEHYGDVSWSSYTGNGTWGRCSTCSTALREGWVCACGSLLCNVHLAYCKICLEPACMEHRAVCHICNSTFCAAHNLKCEICRKTACTDHGGECSVCNRKVCSACSQKKGLIKSRIVCSACAG